MHLADAIVDRERSARDGVAVAAEAKLGVGGETAEDGEVGEAERSGAGRRLLGGGDGGVGGLPWHGVCLLWG